MDANEIVIATFDRPLIARYEGEWKRQGPGWPEAVELTWTLAFGDEPLDVVDGCTGRPSRASLDGLEAVVWVKPRIKELSATCVELVFEVYYAHRLGSVLSKLRWRFDKQKKRIEQWVEHEVDTE